MSGIPAVLMSELTGTPGCSKKEADPGGGGAVPLGSVAAVASARATEKETTTPKDAGPRSPPIL